MQEALEKDLEKLRAVINYDFLFDTDITKRGVIKYYKKNKYMFYRWMAKSKNGMMHLGLSEDGTCIKDKFYGYYQVDFIHDYIRKENCTTILEIGSGQGANLCYLANKNKHCSFLGVDLYPSIDKKLDNVTLFSGDYHNLEMIKDGSVDLVYAIETLCYSTNKNQVFQEINRVLKPGGLFIIFDGYANKRRSLLTDLELEVMDIMEKGWALDTFEFVDNMDKYIANNHFEIVEKENMKNKLQAHVDSYKERLDQLFKYKMLFKVAPLFVSKEVLGNIMPVYLLSSTIKYELSCYYLHVLKKIK